ncbi:LrgB family protein [Geomicrobium sp. JCM 19039]|uniref:LrgB family protein n=1 Tax=Geomicrobium sp. JCM 19039 TaxID=1460636 RepID=UPI00045F1AA0|nr:LrgB family protein [Geomicrobium sp. JCM 19039]GAK12985.1 LrgA-associated membrane protein LrgB [Geomicrobium sp. JCM 19039]
MNEWLIAIIFILLTVGIYMLARKLHQMHKALYTMPFITGTVFLVVLLIVFQIPYETYQIGGEWLEMWLGPAIVALAVPLYKERHTLKKYFFPIMVPVLTGAATGVVSVYALAAVAGIDQSSIHALVPKSVTAPVAMDIAEALQAEPSVAALFVLVAGVSGVLLSSVTFRMFKIDHPLARGIALGASAHAIGTAIAMEKDSLEGAASSVSMTISALLLSMLTPLLAFILI